MIRDGQAGQLGIQDGLNNAAAAAAVINAQLPGLTRTFFRLYVGRVVHLEKEKVLSVCRPKTMLQR